MRVRDVFQQGHSTVVIRSCLLPNTVEAFIGQVLSRSAIASVGRENILQAHDWRNVIAILRFHGGDVGAGTCLSILHFRSQRKVRTVAYHTLGVCEQGCRDIRLVSARLQV